MLICPPIFVAVAGSVGAIVLVGPEQRIDPGAVGQMLRQIGAALEFGHPAVSALRSVDPMSRTL